MIYVGGWHFLPSYVGIPSLIPWNVRDPYMGVSKNRDTQKWMVYSGKPITIDDLGVPLFLETPISNNQYMSWKVSGFGVFFFVAHICWGRSTVNCFPFGDRLINWIVRVYISGQIIATSHDLTPNGGLVREIPLFHGNPGWWNIIIWPDISNYPI